MEEDFYDHCYECTGYGGDYYEAENSELASVCLFCPYNQNDDDRDGYYDYNDYEN